MLNLFIIAVYIVLLMQDRWGSNIFNYFIIITIIIAYYFTNECSLM